MKEVIIDIRNKIKANLFNNEAAVSQGIVQRLLNTLGWPVYNTEIVIPEYSLEGRRVDFALCNKLRKPIIFIEVKQLRQCEGADKQLFQYAFMEGIPMAILTDGQEWHFFLPGEQGNYGDRRFYKLDLLEREPEESVNRLKRYLEYNSVCSGKSIELAKEDFRDITKKRQVKANLPIAWKKLVEEKDEILIDLISDKVESLCCYKPEKDLVISFLIDLTQKIILPNEPPKETLNTVPKKPDNLVNIKLTNSHFQNTYKYKVHNAEATMIINNNNYLILKDSTAVIEIKKSMPSNAQKKRKELISSGKLVLNSNHNLYVFTENVSFNSPSLASCVISGASTNGWLCFNIPKS